MATTLLNDSLDRLLIGDLSEKRALTRFFAHCFESANSRVVEMQEKDKLSASSSTSSQGYRFRYGSALTCFGLRSLRDMVGCLNTLVNAKRNEIDEKVEDMEKGLKVMHEAEQDSIKLKTAVTELQLVAEEKRGELENLQELLAKEEEKVEKEEAKVSDFDAYVAAILDDANNEREIIVGDLNQAVPFLESMKGAVESIERADLGITAKLNKLPHSVVDDVFGCLVVMFAGCNESIKTNSAGKVDDRARSWAAARVSLLANINGFIDSLTNYKTLIETGDVPAVNMKDVRR
jgi:hypothetical protein